MSTGKDSVATLCYAMETVPLESIRPAFADTGNEHELVYTHLEYLERETGIKVARLRVNFDREIANKREYVLKHWARKGVPQANIDRAVAALVPTGNPFLDLCIWKGKFPSRTSQFCTQFLKTQPLVEYQMGFIDRGEADAVWSWQGVRIDESQNRRNRFACAANIPSCDRLFDVVGGGLFNYRPILRWTAEDVFEAAALFGLKPNPLYKMGMSRVGCMPCINASKDEVLEISKRFPGHIDRIEYWELMVGLASKRQESSFFPDPDRDAHLNKRGIRNVVEWSKTKRGGQLMDFIRIMDEPKACQSAYGLCE